MASDDNRVTIRLDEFEAADVASAMRFRGIRNKSDFLRQAIAAEVRRVRREMQAEEHPGLVAEDQAPYGRKTAKSSAVPDSPAVQALEEELPHIVAKLTGQKHGAPAHADDL